MASALANLPVERVHPNPRNVRRDLGDLTELTASIRTLGVLQPVVVRPGRNAGQFILVDGHRRYEATLRAGLGHVPALGVSNAEGNQETAIMLASAMHRQLTPLEQAAAFERLSENGWTVKRIADATGYSQGTIRNRLNLMALPLSVRERVTAGQLGATEAAVLGKQVRRTGSGSTTTGHRPAWFTSAHPLAGAAKALCGHRKERSAVGGVACGQCWEDVIRADARRVPGVGPFPVAA